MGRSKCIVNINIANAGKTFCKAGVVICFFLVISQVFKKKHITVAEFDEVVLQLALRRSHQNGVLEAIVSTDCETSGGCIERYLTRSMRLLTPEEYRQEVAVWMARNRVE